MAYIVGVERCVVLPVGVVLDIIGLGAVLEESLAGSLVDGFELAAAEDDGLDRPVWGHNIVDLCRGRGDNTEVLASAEHSPPQIGLAVDRLQVTIGENDIERLELVRDEAVMALEPAVSTTESGAQVADAFACSSDGLLSCCPETLGQVVRVDAAAYGHRLSVFGNFEGVELGKVNLNPIIHLSQRDESAMVPIVSKNGDIVFVCEGNLAQTVLVSCFVWTDYYDGDKENLRSVKRPLLSQQQQRHWGPEVLG